MRPDTWHLFTNPSVLGFFLGGFGQTIFISIAAIALSFALGLLLALARLSRSRWVRWPATGCIEIVRALPVYLLIVYFGIKGSSLGKPFLGPDFDMPRFWGGVIGLSLYTSAVLAEIIRAGIVSLPRGQTEAARALGFGPIGTMRLILLPQALRLMVPAMMSQLTTIIKDTSLVGQIGVFELYRSARIIYTQYFNPIEALLFVSFLYFGICFTLSQFSRRLELGNQDAQRVRKAALRSEVA